MLRILAVVVHMIRIFHLLFAFSAWIFHVSVTQTELNQVKFKFVFYFVLVKIRQPFCTFTNRKESFDDEYHHVVLESGEGNHNVFINEIFDSVMA